MRFKNWQPPEFDETGMTRWHWKCQHHQKLVLGEKVDIGSFTYINARYGVEIGNDVQIGSHCAIYSESTIDNKKGKVIIEPGARVGSHCVITPGVTIGAKAVIGAGSFVNKSIPPQVVAYGSPARVIKQ